MVFKVLALFALRRVEKMGFKILCLSFCRVILITWKISGILTSIWCVAESKSNKGPSWKLCCHIKNQDGCHQIYVLYPFWISVLQDFHHTRDGWHLSGQALGPQQPQQTHHHRTLQHALQPGWAAAAFMKTTFKTFVKLAQYGVERGGNISGYCGFVTEHIHFVFHVCVLVLFSSVFINWTQNSHFYLNCKNIYIFFWHVALGRDPETHPKHSGGII